MRAATPPRMRGITAVLFVISNCLPRGASTMRGNAFILLDLHLAGAIHLDPSYQRYIHFIDQPISQPFHSVFRHAICLVVQFLLYSCPCVLFALLCFASRYHDHNSNPCTRPQPPNVSLYPTTGSHSTTYRVSCCNA